MRKYMLKIVYEIKKLKFTMLLTLLSLFVFPITVKAEVNNNLIMYYSILPENVRAFIGTKNVSFNSVDTIYYYPAMENVTGLTTFNMNGDLVTGMTVQIKKGREDCLIHEIGHVIDTAGGTLYSLSSTPAFTQIYAAERYKNTQYFYTNGTDNAHEYFAESFNQYITNPDTMKKYNPLTYKYIRNIVKGL